MYNKPWQIGFTYSYADPGTRMRVLCSFFTLQLLYWLCTHRGGIVLHSGHFYHHLNHHMEEYHVNIWWVNAPCIACQNAMQTWWDDAYDVFFIIKLPFYEILLLSSPTHPLPCQERWWDGANKWLLMGVHVWPMAAVAIAVTIINCTKMKELGMIVCWFLGWWVWAQCGTRPQGWSNKREKEGGETGIINNDEGEADKATTTGVIVIGRDAMAVASTRGTLVWIQVVQGGGGGLASMRGGGRICDKISRKMTRRCRGVCHPGEVGEEAMGSAYSRWRRSRCSLVIFPPLQFGQWWSRGGIEGQIQPVASNRWGRIYQSLWWWQQGDWLH